jgi:hypothetical protein
MNLEEFIAALETAAQKYALDVQIISKTQNSVKTRLPINESIAVQCYYNQKSATTNFVMIGWSRRLYGRDSVGGTWHRHPFDDPDLHDHSATGSIPVEPEQFLDEVFEILINEGLISPPVPDEDDP